MSVSKEIIFEEMERVEREEYDEDGKLKKVRIALTQKYRNLGKCLKNEALWS